GGHSPAVSRSAPLTQTVRSAVSLNAIEAEPAGNEEAIPVTVTYIPTGSPRTITIAGSFNGWDKARTRLSPVPRSLAWSVTLHLAPGIYQYRLVINGSRWITPQDAPRWNDGSGNINGLLAVAPPDFARQA